jgi:hypothetical protein
MSRLVARTGFLVSLCAALLLFELLAMSRETVRSELGQLQSHSGLRLVSVRDGKMFTLSFADRTMSQSKPLIDTGTGIGGTVSPDGKRVAIALCSGSGFTHPGPSVTDCPSGFILATVRSDGTDLREYRDFANPWGICWSHDMSRLVLVMSDRRRNRYEAEYLQILNLETDTTEIIADGSDAFVESQCWSVDDKRVVYTVNKPLGIQIARSYDTRTKTSTDLASGGHVTWSPDGNWIAFLYCPPSLRGCKYYGIRTSSGEKKLLFETTGETSLWWSPDSRFVAYVDGAGFFERTLSEQFREKRRLRVRRVEDGEEDWFADFFDGDTMGFDWVR